MSAETELAGRLLAGRYDLLELLGTGGMGAVYRARDRELDELVALKVIRDELARDPVMVGRFRHEVKLARRVTHVNVARTFELGRDGEILFCTMELVVGESLARRLAGAHRLDVAEAVAIATALCDGLEVAHAAGVIHRDIKPDNVLIAEGGRVVLADFGVAALAGAGELSGTPAYMAPEQARGDAVTAASDVYAVGIVLHEMLTARRAFAGDAAVILADKQRLERVEVEPGALPPELAAVIAHATERDVAVRVASAAELRRQLAPWARAPRLTAEPQSAAAHGGDVVTVILVAPHAEARAAKAYLAMAVYDRVLAKLARTPRLRVLPRPDANDPATLAAWFALHGEALEVCVGHPGGVSFRLEMPLASEQLDAIVDASAQAVGAAAATAAAGSPSEASLEVRDLLLRAAFAWQVDFRAVDWDALLGRARELAPDDPRVTAMFAIACVRRAFFQPEAPADTLAQAATAARTALAGAPELVETQLAAGHVELHLGNPVAAARHYRAAIARAPHHPEAHDYLGRMLLEAGYIEEATARLEMALAIQPTRAATRWELARLHALLGRWDEYDRLVDELRAGGHDRLVARARFATWRKDVSIQHELLRERRHVDVAFLPGLMEATFDVHARGKWDEREAQMLAFVRQRSPNKRRSTFLAQLVAEAAGAADRPEIAADVIAWATGDGLFDLHWLDLCPLLAGVRALPRFAALREPIKARADAILDALYGERDLGTSDTAIAPSAAFSAPLR